MNTKRTPLAAILVMVSVVALVPAAESASAWAQSGANCTRTLIGIIDGVPQYEYTYTTSFYAEAGYNALDVLAEAMVWGSRVSGAAGQTITSQQTSDWLDNPLGDFISVQNSGSFKSTLGYLSPWANSQASVTGLLLNENDSSQANATCPGF